MTRRLVAGILLVVAAAGSWPASAAGQGMWPPSAAGQGTRPPPGAGQALTPAEVERLWDTYVAAQARTALNLDDQQFMRFAARLRNLQNLRRRLQRERNRLRAELNALTGRGAEMDRRAVTTKLREFDDHAVQSAQQIRRAYGALDAVLNLRQRVRFRVFEERMAARKLELLAEARRAARGGGGRVPERPGAL